MEETIKNKKLKKYLFFIIYGIVFCVLFFIGMTIRFHNIS